MKIGWVGTGVMGVSMAGHLLKAGHSLTVYNRTRERAVPLLDAGATWAATPRAVAEASDVVCSIVGYPADVEQVYLGDSGMFAGLTPGSLAIDFTTSSPTLARHLAEEGAARQIDVLDAPVSGGDVGARQATLSIMVGGTQASFARGRPVLDTMGKTVVLQGPPGSGQHTKMVNQILIAGTMIGVGEALIYAERAGLDMPLVLDSVGGGAAASWSLQNLVPRILAGNLEPGFYVEHFIKDMGIALEEAERYELALPGLALAKQLYQAVLACGGARKGTQAIVLALRALSGQAPLARAD